MAKKKKKKTAPKRNFGLAAGCKGRNCLGCGKFVTYPPDSRMDKTGFCMVCRRNGVDKKMSGNRSKKKKPRR